jgi:uncharacterized protein YdeI (YjbR/CyaY-like superfamily)
MSQRSTRKPQPSPRPRQGKQPAASAQGVTDPRIDAYIARAAPFAQPILTHLRALIHTACPGVHETIKWSRPFFEHHGILCMMAAFKQHCHYVLWSSLVEHGKRADHLRRITAISELPPRSEMLTQLRAAAAANEASGGAKPMRRTRSARASARVTVPADLRAGLARVPAADRVFAAFTPGRRREYIDWLNEAKREATRASRLAQALEWISQGKSRNWKYQSA